MGCSSSKPEVTSTFTEPDLLVSQLEVVVPPAKPQPSRPGLSVTCKEIRPEIGFVIKTRTVDGEKIFINIFHHEAIAPETIAPGYFRQSKDKAGKETRAFDVILNSKRYRDTVVNGEERHLLCLNIIDTTKTFRNVNLNAGRQQHPCSLLKIDKYYI